MAGRVKGVGAAALAAVMAVTAAGGTAYAEPAVPGSVGYDSSHLNAGQELPSKDFAVVNVNGGKFNEYNPDFTRQWEHAVALGTTPALYLTPANLQGGTFWGQGPRCTGGVSAPLSTVCAHDYGYVGAMRAVDYALAAGMTQGTEVQWWIDIEADVTWMDDRPDLNAAVLRGVRDALQASGTASSIGIYVVGAHWRDLIAPTAKAQRAASDLAALPVWAVGGGQATAAQARRVCTRRSPTRGTGPIVVGQSFAESAEVGFSVDVVCPVKLGTPGRITTRGVAAVRGTALPGTRVRVVVKQRGRSARTAEATANALGVWKLKVNRLAPRTKATVRVVGGPSKFLAPAR